MTDQIARIKTALTEFEALVRKSLGDDDRFLKGVMENLTVI